MTQRTCTTPGCDRKHYAKDLCCAHYNRLRRLGDVQPDRPVEVRLLGVQHCQADGCPTAKIDALGYCRKHYYRMTTHGTLAKPVRGVAEENPKWIGDAAGYRAVHTRLRKAFGKAATHACVDCDRQAQEWSYDHSDPDEGYDERGCLFSTDLARYEPRCKKCHAAFDEKIYKAWEKRRASA